MPEAREYVLHDLKPGTFYRFKMTCYNEAGEGPVGNMVVQPTQSKLHINNIASYNTQSNLLIATVVKIYQFIILFCIPL
jgi:hypothetical protein